MGEVIHWPGPRHARASVGAERKPKRAGSAVLPLSASALAKIRKTSDGNLPRARQLLTAGKLTPAMSATAEVPPMVSITASTVVSMPPAYSRFVKMSSDHTTAIVTECELRPNWPMSRSIKDIAGRVEVTQEALHKSAADICRDTGIKPNQWSQYLNAKAKRPITRQAVWKLKDAYGVTFEWLYDGDIASLPDRAPDHLRSKVLGILRQREAA